ncbi:MAG: LacI family transcriptional regulator, partial [Lachnospiraceae bacterium]|nr:LacI family transcriptional regulator [Lachnospiraceae bacterium]
MKRATLKDVSELAGVSKATVSYIVNNVDKPISEETRNRVLKAMKELNYVPNIGAASLTNKSSRLIGVVIPQTEPGSRLMFRNSFYSELLGSI